MFSEYLFGCSHRTEFFQRFDRNRVLYTVHVCFRLVSLNILIRQCRNICQLKWLPSISISILVAKLTNQHLQFHMLIHIQASVSYFHWIMNDNKQLQEYKLMPSVDFFIINCITQKHLLNPNLIEKKIAIINHEIIILGRL